MSDIIKQKDTRRVFVDTLDEIADDKTVVVIPDVGFTYLDGVHRFEVINLGVTEQSAMAIAAGLALGGMKPYYYSMINFSVFRPFEMVRNCVALHKANVKIIGVSGSEKYKFLGFSHNTIFDDEDTYHLEPYMECFTPELEDVEMIIRDTFASDKPCYIRL